MRRGARVAAWVLGRVAALALLLIAALLMAGNTAAGRAMIERVTFRLTGGHVQLVGLGGSFPTEPTLSQLRLIDRGGVWLSADRIALRWSPWALLERRIAVDDLAVGARSTWNGCRCPSPRTAARCPFRTSTSRSFSSTCSARRAARRQTRHAFGARRRPHASLEDADADASRVARTMTASTRLHFKFDPQRMDGTLEVHEPASGPLENILQLPGLGALVART